MLQSLPDILLKYLQAQFSYQKLRLQSTLAQFMGMMALFLLLFLFGFVALTCASVLVAVLLGKLWGGLAVGVAVVTVFYVLCAVIAYLCRKKLLAVLQAQFMQLIDKDEK